MLNQCTEITEVAKSLNLVCVNNSHLKVVESHVRAGHTVEPLNKGHALNLSLL
jgi:hypothetical protein